MAKAIIVLLVVAIVGLFMTWERPELYFTAGGDPYTDCRHVVVENPKSGFMYRAPCSDAAWVEKWIARKIPIDK